MKPMFLSFTAILIIAAVAWYTLGKAGFSSRDVQAGESVRLD